MTAEADYLLGHADPELERLQFQARILEGVTRRLLSESGVVPGMRLLDIGCGVGDVSMLLAEVVGPSGSVVAIDREPVALEKARQRALKAGYRQIEFSISSDETLADYGVFDGVFGRYILVHQPDPALMVRRAAAAVRPGGIVAFLEMALHIVSFALPEVELFRRVAEGIATAAHAILPNPDVAGRLINCFEDAGLPTPSLIWESIVGGPASPIAEWAAMSYKTYRPHLERLGLQGSQVGDPATLNQRLAVAIAAARAQIVSSPQVSAWVIRP